MKPTILALALAAAACPASVEQEDPRKDGPAPLLDAARGVAAADNAFGLDLYRELCSKEGNLLFSPHSIAVALAMVHEGAAGKTRAQMASALHFDAGTASAGAHRDLDLLLEPGMVRIYGRDPVKNVPAFELSTANRVWADEELQRVASFSERLEAVFAAPVETVDFGRPAQVRKRINAWVARRTGDRIRDIVPDGQPSAEALLALANAIYFKARWEETFHEGGTVDAPFHRVRGGAIEVPMMRQQHSFAYADTADLQVLELCYRGRETSMVILLPRTVDGITELEKGLDAKRLTTLLDALASRVVSVTLPRFRFEASFELSSTLERLGMPDAFSFDTADFSGISKEQQLAIDAVLHKAFIAVDEEGTEATAATVIMTVGAAIDPEEPVPFTADHPFLFLIRHQATGAILFMGRVADPSR